MLLFRLHIFSFSFSLHALRIATRAHTRTHAFFRSNRKYNNVTHTVSRTLVHLQLTICFMKFLLFTKYHKNHTSLCSRQKGQPNIVLCRSKKKDDPKRNAVLTQNESFRFFRVTSLRTSCLLSPPRTSSLPPPALDASF